MALKALEFYSGIGAFAQAAGEFDLQIVQAFDQSQWANLTYNANYGQMPVSRNLDTIEANLIPENRSLVAVSLLALPSVGEGCKKMPQIIARDRFCI